MEKGKETKPHIGIYGRRNVGKSSLINALTGQEISIVSEQKGTTTDPVKRSYEILNFAPVIFIDTAGIDDFGDVGKLRVNKTIQTIDKINLALIIISENNFGDFEELIIKECKKFSTPFIIIHNKSDLETLNDDLANTLSAKYNVPVIEFSAKENSNKEILFNLIKDIIPENSWELNSLMGDLLKPNDVVLLIMPIDTEAPSGRMILPQVQAIRDVLDNNCVCIGLKESELDFFLKNNTNLKISLAVTDSQMFGRVDKIVPENIPLTGFSILLARNKGDFYNYLKGTPKISELKDGDKVLILESCSHHVSCDDIGRFKIPNWISNFTKKRIQFVVVAGLDNIPGNITDYALLVQCGGCMITKRQIINRLKPAVDAGIPVTNYGMLIAYIHGIFDKSVSMFKK
ncbi:MAG: [FeFe] hydrogenase H-cluster maturation GTPase HydF [Bacteroidales bacterium]|jgi:[FeFe] hydrogenase H-cluster maturation GTPase HydF|nr:[FeFe] hydrogenase H-cluster maturation GTPase HydF [Bacteroidales bacterium]